jgi:hypothetical protein
MSRKAERGIGNAVYMNKEDRRIVRAYLEEALAKLGYSLSPYYSGYRLNVNLKTRDNFASATCSSPDDKLPLQIADGKIWFPFASAIGEWSRKLIARVADPECAAKVTQFVAKYHLDLLEQRLLLHSTYSEEVNETIARLSNSLQDLSNPAE